MSEPPEETRLSHQWLEKAEGDLSSAEYLLTSPDAQCRFDVICFHAQQCAEKALKAFLVLHKIPFERIHDLGELLELCRVADQDLVRELDEVDVLTPYAVETRYPGDWEPFDRPRAEEAVALARKVHEGVRRRLKGIL